MDGFLDLHLHSTASDGLCSPSEMVRRSAKLGLRVIALCDHDTIAGVQEAVDEGLRRSVEVIPGVELSAGGTGEVHVLGYGLDITNPTLNALLSRMGKQRTERMEAMRERLVSVGIPISEQEIKTIAAGGQAGRAHMARLLVQKGFSKDIKSAFASYLSPGRPGYVPREKLTVANVISVIHDAGGVAVVAHPGLLQLSPTALEAMLRSWASEGLDGAEVYHPSHNMQVHTYLNALVRRLGLLVTGGSDCHGSEDRAGIGEGMDRWRTSAKDVAILRARINKRKEISDKHKNIVQG